jgi:hypothetical protein
MAVYGINLDKKYQKPQNRSAKSYLKASPWE